MKKNHFKPAVKPFLFVGIGLILGWFFFHSQDVEHKHTGHDEVKKNEVWTCSMHPQIKTDKPGLCPLCAMDLIPLTSDKSVDSSEIVLSAEAMQLANVQTTTIMPGSNTAHLRLYGKVQADERLLQSQVAHVNGRIERLLVNFTGESVRKGQLLAVIYAPEWLEAQQEFLEALTLKSTHPELYQAARHKLLQWMVTDQQMAQLETSKRPKSTLEVYANTSGIVIQKRVNQGDYVQQGSVLFEIANLSKVWVLFDAYESDLPFIHIGDPVQFTLQSIPGKTFTSRIRYIDQVLDASARVVRVRVEMANPDGKIKPEMFATGTVSGRLNHQSEQLLVPRSAVLWTGKRSLVYLRTGDGIFQLQEVEIGPVIGNHYAVIDGLYEGDEVVSNGTYQVDAAAQLEGKSSMMNHTHTGD